MNFVHLVGKTIVGFIGKRSGKDAFHAGAAGGISEESRIDSVAGNDPERVWNFHEARLMM